MKMGTTASPWRYDAAARHALQSVHLRRLVTLRYASWAAAFPISQGGPSGEMRPATNTTAIIEILDIAVPLVECPFSTEENPARSSERIRPPQLESRFCI